MYPDYNSQQQYQQYPADTARVGSLVNSTMKRVYFKMTLGLIVTAVVSLLCTAPEYLQFVQRNSWVRLALIIAEFGIVFAISGAIRRISTPVATLLFYVFAVINGMMLFTIFYAYSLSAITKTFFITAGTFGAMSVYGYFTSRDLSRIGSFLTMALFGLIIAVLVNFFVRSSALDWIISIVGVFIFVGLTAWDTQQVKTMAEVTPSDQAGRLSTIRALTLYLDFINLFLFLLRIFGGNRD